MCWMNFFSLFWNKMFFSDNFSRTNSLGQKFVEKNSLRVNGWFKYVLGVVCPAKSFIGDVLLNENQLLKRSVVSNVWGRMNLKRKGNSVRDERDFSFFLFYLRKRRRENSRNVLKWRKLFDIHQQKKRKRFSKFSHLEKYFLSDENKISVDFSARDSQLCRASSAGLCWKFDHQRM